MAVGVRSGCLVWLFSLLWTVCIVNNNGAGAEDLREARILASKTLLSNYAVEGKEFVITYHVYNVGEKPAQNVRLFDDNFPADQFELIKGMTTACWERIPGGVNVTHSVFVKPLMRGEMNYTAAEITYSVADSPEERKAYSTAPETGYVYRLKDYERKFEPHYSDWAVFVLMITPSLALPALLWMKSKHKYQLMTRGNHRKQH